MSRWLQAYYNEPNTIEIDKPNDEEAIKKLQYVFNCLQKVCIPKTPFLLPSFLLYILYIVCP